MTDGSGILRTLGGVTHETNHPLVSDARVRAAGVIFSTAAQLERTLSQCLVSECGLPHTWFEVLLRLDAADDRQLTPGQLADAMVLTSGGMTRLIDRICDAGLVERRPSTTDRRSSRLRLTSAGDRRLLEAAALHARNVQEHLFDVLGEQQTTRLLALLVALRDSDGRRATLT